MISEYTIWCLVTFHLLVIVKFLSISSHYHDHMDYVFAFSILYAYKMTTFFQNLHVMVRWIFPVRYR